MKGHEEKCRVGMGGQQFLAGDTNWTAAAEVAVGSVRKLTGVPSSRVGWVRFGSTGVRSC